MPETKIVQPIPYLSFDGNCAEAIRFYEKALGGTIDLIMTHGESPMKDQVPPAMHDKVMNARLRLPGGGILFGGDAFDTFEGIKGVSLALVYETNEEAEEAFNKLAEGGAVTMPFGPTFWAEKFGMVSDKYGVHWMVNGVMTM